MMCVDRVFNSCLTLNVLQINAINPKSSIFSSIPIGRHYFFIFVSNQNWHFMEDFLPNLYEMSNKIEFSTCFPFRHLFI